MNSGIAKAAAHAVHEKALWPFHQNRITADPNQRLDGLEPDQFSHNPVSPFNSSRQTVNMAECGPNEIRGIVEDDGSLRHTFGTLMNANGEDLKTIQEMLRHATFRVTADIYTQAITDTKREAHNKVVKQLITEPGGDEGENAAKAGLIGPFWTHADLNGSP
jgi:integrase